MIHNNSTNNLFLNQKVTPVSTDYTMLPDDVILTVNTSAPRSMILPSPATNQGKVLIIKDVSGNAAMQTISITTPSGLIDGNQTYNISSNYGSIELYSTGTNYSSTKPFTTTYASGGWAKYAQQPFLPGSTRIAGNASNAVLPDTARWDFSALSVVTPVVNLQVDAQTITFTQSGLYHIIAQAVVSVLSKNVCYPILQMIKNRKEVTCSFSTSAILINCGDIDYQQLNIFYTDRYLKGDSIDFRSGTWQSDIDYQFSVMSCFVQQLPDASLS